MSALPSLSSTRPFFAISDSVLRVSRSAFAAAALASQLGQLKAIQSQSFGGGGGSVAGGAPPALPASSSPTSQAEQRAEQPTLTTYVRIPEDAILTGRKMLDFIDEAMGDGKQLNS